MDRILTQKRFRWKKWLPYTLVGALLLIVITVTSLSTGKRSLRVDAETIQVSAVTQGEFVEAVPVTGTVEPLRTVFLDAVEGGTVQERLVEPGSIVEKGQPLLRLSNTNLMLDFMNRETQMVEQINNLRSTRIQMELNERTLQEQVLDIEFQLGNMERQFAIDTQLYRDAVIARKEFEDSHAQYRLLQEKKVLLLDTYEKDAAYRQVQLARIDHSINRMERNLDAVRSYLENLVVRAPISGHLTALDAEIGESKSRGENLGRIDQLDGFRISARVDEYYINRIQPGQTATFTSSGKTGALKVERVLPEVTNNQFEVQLQFTDSIPAALRRGQSFRLQLELGQSEEVVLIPRGGFYNSTGGQWVFVLTEDGTAEKRSIELGRQNLTYFEVRSGLQPNDRVITSGYDSWELVDRLIITN